MFAASLCAATAALAAPAGVVMQASGPLFSQTEQGRIKALAADSVVVTGDTLVTGRETFAQVRFADGAIATMGPDTRLAIDGYAFEASNPAADRSQLTLATGSLQVLPGAIARRSADRQSLSTPLGEIKPGASTFIIQFVGGDARRVAAAEPIRLASLTLTLSDAIVVAQASPPTGGQGGLAAGLYVHVIDGIINLSNKGGSQSFTAGQFGYTPSLVQPPVVVPANPGLHFSPPPSFSSSSSGTQSGSGGNKSGNVDCEVR